MGRPTDWWPVSDTDPVPGDPETLAAFGSKMKNVAAAIEQMANTLPKLASSEEWDSEAGDAFRTKAQSVATSIGKAHGRFIAVATALGTSTYGGSGYAAALQSCQDEADSQIERVVGSSGSEALRLSTWNQLIEATGGLSPEYPVPKSGSTSGGQRVPAGAYPAAAPGNIPPDLPNCPGDNAEVTALKGTYNGALATLRSAALKISQATNDQVTAAQHAASMIQNVIDNDGLNNPSGWDSFWHGVESFYDHHVVGVLKMISEISGWIATVCGIIAMVLAFIPGLQPLAAAFETLSLLATAVQLVCSLVLAVTGHGGWLDVGLDLVALVTMGMGKGLIGAAAEGAKGLTGAAEIFGKLADEADLARDSADAFDLGGRGTQAALSELTGAAAKNADLLPSDLIGEASGRMSSLSKAWEGMKAAFNAKSAFSELGDSGNWKTLSAALKNGDLITGLKGFAGMGSHEIVESVETADGAVRSMNSLWLAKNMAGNIAAAQAEFRVVQGIAVGTDLIIDKANLLGDIGLQNVRDWDWPFKESG
jgi:hypothetical protein